MKKAYICPNVIIRNVTLTPILAGSDLDRGTEADGVANAKGASSFDDEDDEF